MTDDKVNEMVMNTIQEMIRKITGNNELIITDSTKLMEDLDFDSLAVMELLSEIEEVFSVDYTDLENFEERFEKCGDLYVGILELLYIKEGEKADAEKRITSDNV